MTDLVDDITPGDGPPRVTLPDASQAVMDVIEECYADLAAVRHRLDGGEDRDVELEIEGELPSPREQAHHVAARLEAAAGMLRSASERSGGEGASTRS